MIECSQCGAKYPTERLFCGKCKERLGIRCSVCGFINLLDDLFCGICLTELNTQMGISVGSKSEEPVFSESPLYKQILMSAQEDEVFFADDSEKISQEDIDEIFQEEQEEMEISLPFTKAGELDEE